MSLTAAQLFANVGLSGASQTVSGLKQVGSQVDSTHGSLSKLGSITKSVGGGLSHAASQIGGLVSSIGLMAGVGGVLGVAGMLEQSIGKAEDLGTLTLKLTQITGESVQSMSALIAVGNEWGISAESQTSAAAMFEKTVGKLMNTRAAATKVQASARTASLEQQKLDLQAAGDKTTLINKLISESKAEDALAAAHGRVGVSQNKLQALQTQYGVTLTDSQGKALSYTDTLKNLSVMFQKATTAAEKATAASVASQVLGKAFKTNLPLLELGPEKYAQAAALAQSLGETVTDANMAQLNQLRQVQQTWTTTLGGLEVQAGLTIIPMLTDIGNAANKFLGDPSNRASLLGALTSVESMARQVAGVIVTVGHAIANIWAMIPAPMKTLIVGGAILNKTSGWLFGGSPLSAITKAGGGVASSLLGGLLGRVPGGSQVAGALGVDGQRVYVTNWPLSLGGLTSAGPGDAAPVAGAAEAAGGIGLGTLAAGAGLTAVAAAAVGAVYIDQQGKLNKQADAVTNAIQKQTADGGSTLQQLAKSYLGVTAGQTQANSNPILQAFSAVTGTNSKLDAMKADLVAALTARGVKIDPATLQALANGTGPGATSSTAPTSHLGIIANTLRDMAKNNKPLNAASVLPMLQALNSGFTSSTDASGKSVANAVKQETALMNLAYKQGNTALGDAIKQALADLNASITYLDGTLVSLPGAISGSIAGWTQGITGQVISAATSAAATQAYRAGERGGETPAGATTIHVTTKVTTSSVANASLKAGLYGRIIPNGGYVE